MIRLIVILFCINHSYAALIPGKKDSVSSTQFTARVFKKINKKYKAQAEFNHESEIDRQFFLLGLKYKLNKMVKLGFFYKNSQGERHDEDWKINNSKASWEKTKSRHEDSLIFDILPRFDLSDIMTIPILFENRFRVEYNGHNSNLLLKLRPSLRYFFFYKGEVLFNYFSQIEFYIPLNFGNNFLYGVGIYNGLSFKITKNFFLGPTFTYLKETWTQTDSFKNLTGQTFEQERIMYLYGLTAVLQF